MQIILSEAAKGLFPKYVVKNRAIIIEPTSYIYRALYLNGSSSGHRRLEVFSMALFSPHYTLTLELKYPEIFSYSHMKPSLRMDPNLRESNINTIHEYMVTSATYPLSPADWLLQIDDPHKFLDGLLRIRNDFPPRIILYSIACSHFLCGNISECLKYLERMKSDVDTNNSPFDDKLLTDVGDKLHLVEDDPIAFTKFLQQTCFEMATQTKCGITPKFD